MSLAISTGIWVALIVLFFVDLFAIIFGLSFARANRAAKARAEGRELPAKPVKAVSRRDFFRRSLLVSLAVFGAQFGAATLGFLWPNLKGGFGSLINAGPIADIKAQIQETAQPAYNGTGRFYLVPYSGTPSGDVDYSVEGVMAEGIMPLYQRCVHLGCRVPFCNSSKWFECPCHGSKYNLAGEYQLGPAPRGLDRFKITIDSGNIMVDTAGVILGPPRGTDTIDEPPQGAFCVAPG
jgi:cytochrome b6-f complex iron-sulfur subunit